MLEGEALDRTTALVSSLELLGEFAIGELLVAARRRARRTEWVILGHTVGRALGWVYDSESYRAGTSLDQALNPLIESASWHRSIVEGSWGPGSAPALVAPVGEMGASEVVLVHLKGTHQFDRPPREADRIRADCFYRLVSMTGRGSFPFHPPDHRLVSSFRPTDGYLLLDECRRIEFASRRGVESMIDLGAGADLVGSTLADAGVPDPTEPAWHSGVPQSVSIPPGSGIHEIVCFPLDRRSGIVSFSRSPIGHSGQELMLSTDAVVRELQYRVGNNLQIMSSMAALAARRKPRETAAVIAADLARRLQVLARAHMAIARDVSSNRQPLGALLQSTVTALASSFEPTIRISADADVGAVTSDAAPAVVLLVTELLQNCVDHAPQPGSRVLNVSVRTRPVAGGVQVLVSDDGVGLPTSFELPRSAGFGLGLALLICDDLGATLRVRNRSTLSAGTAGTEAELFLPKQVTAVSHG